MSAVVCSCSQTKVACLRHYKGMCDPPTSPAFSSLKIHKYFFLFWLTVEDMNSMVEATEKYTSGLDSGNRMTDDELAKFWVRFERV
mmetsp:Transcript_17873/g.26467  ORF Transcript_17873/g.26467 Transcript_17873/m.26467 type:complete len:86 (-) Transcript_17873:306-563(-)